MTVAAPPLTKVPNYVNGQWIESKASEWLDVTNPATGEPIAKVPLSSAKEVGEAVEAAADVRLLKTAFSRFSDSSSFSKITSTNSAASSPRRMARLSPKPRPNCAARSKTSKWLAAFRR